MIPIVPSVGSRVSVRYRSPAGSDKPLTDAQKIKYQVDAVLDGLIVKFEPQL